MTFSDFTLDAAESALGVRVGQAPLFPGLQPLTTPSWLGPLLDRSRPFALHAAKARAEFLIAPILLAALEASRDTVGLHSGVKLDADPGKGLAGEADFVVTADPDAYRVRTPLLVVVQARKADVESGLGACVAQMAAARHLTEANGRPAGGPVFGCVTTGEAWQFLRLAGSAVGIDRDRHYIGSPGRILAAILTAVEQARPADPDGDAEEAVPAADEPASEPPPAGNGGSRSPRSRSRTGR